MIASSSVRRWWPRGEWGRRAGESRPRRRPRGRGALAALAGAGAAAVLAPMVAAGQASAQTVPPPAPGVIPGVAVVGNAPSPTPYLFYTAADGSVWMKNLNNAQVTSAGGRLVDGLSAIGDGASMLVFGRGTDNQLWVSSCHTFGSCGSWLPLGGTITSSPGAVFRGPDAADYSVFARGTNGAVWGRDHTTAGWGGWYSAGGNLLRGTGPAAAYLGGTYVVATGTNRELYIAKVGATGFSPAGGSTTASPGLTAIPSAQGAPAALVGFARGTDNVGYYHRFLSSSPGWHSMGGLFSSGLSAATQVQATIPNALVFGLGSDSRVYENSGDFTVYPPVFGGWHPVS
jgi:hypothetical protein